MDFDIKEYLHEILHACLDTLIVFAVLLIIYFVLSFFEGKLANKLHKSKKVSPLIGASLGLIPQCGFSIVAADMYRNKYITIGTLLAVFISTSDEALPIILASPTHFISIFPLLIFKFIIATFFGYLIDFIFKRKANIVVNNKDSHSIVHKGCCKHDIEQQKSSFSKDHIVHPLLHSLKICAYVLIINIIFTTIIYFVGGNSIINFLNSNIYLTPLLSSLVGLIPNCASSVIITQLYVESSLTFSATMAGLICNAGLGIVYLSKDKKQIKNSFLVVGILFAISLIVGYLMLLIEINI